MKKNIILGVFITLVITSIWYIEKKKIHVPSEVPLSISFPENAKGSDKLKALAVMDKAKGYPPAIDILGPAGFINTQNDFRIAPLIGKKIILVDFWTYSCINCIRTFPYLNAWYEKYRDFGLEIVGVHTPEFDFEKDISNVRDAVQKHAIQYPVVLDNNYGTWRAYGNRYWPREYLIDLAGYIVHDKIGEGGYEETEELIRKLLAQKIDIDGSEKELPPGTGASSPQTTGGGLPQSPETYFGRDRAKPQSNYLTGSWKIMPEYAETTGGARINYRYTAKGVYIVAGTMEKEGIEIEVLRDSAPVPKDIAGADIYYRDGRSYIRVVDHRLYRIVDGTERSEHLLEIIIKMPGLRAYTFTFG